MIWSLSRIDPQLSVLRYNPSMISIFLFREETDEFVKFISEITLDKVEINLPVFSNEWGLNVSKLENGAKIVELYSSQKGIAFVVFYQYFEELITLCKEKANGVG